MAFWGCCLVSVVAAVPFYDMPRSAAPTGDVSPFGENSNATAGTTTDAAITAAATAVSAASSTRRFPPPMRGCV